MLLPISITFRADIIESLRSKLRRIFDPQGIIMLPLRSLIPQHAMGVRSRADSKT